jgi:hypothetical protein
MKLTVITQSNAFFNENFTQFVEFKIDDKLVASFHDGEPEDNTISRNFNDIHKISTLIKHAYNAGKRGDEYEVEYIQKSDED